MATTYDRTLRAARTPAVFALLVLVTGVITSMALYSRQGFFGLTGGFVVGDSPNFHSIPIEDLAYTEGTRPSVLVSANDLSYVDFTPDTGQYIWQALTTAPSFIVAAGAFFLVWRLLWRARKEVFIPQVARQVRLLGWWLLAGGLLAPQAEAFAMMRLMDSLTVDPGVYLLKEIPPVVPLVGLGLLALAAVLRKAVRMRDDLKGLV
ncbi:DUF2975 domain-containing protein [Streptosporangium soli]|nr:DUF2975 domain-containing protein [Streptosporangium sp. KLBMP 9127]